MSVKSDTFDELFTIERLNKIYHLGEKVVDCKQIINGHINDTYFVTVADEHLKETGYVFQRVNSYVFSEPVKIMKNLQVLEKWLGEHPTNSRCKILTFLTNALGTNYVTQPNGGFWRISKFVENSVAYDRITDSAILYNTGLGFGEFQKQLAGIPIDDFEETIPDFHNTPKRIDALFDAVEKDVCHRSKDVQEEIKYIEENAKYFSTLEEMKRSGKIPTRIVHNDTKCNNILFDADSREPVCIIDLDTIMPGLVAHDFGDAIRFAANYAQEDEKNLRLVGLNTEYYELFANGFITGAKTVITPAEVESLALGALTMTFEVAVRFLTDYLNGDLYFKIHYPDHNLVRARCQIRLCRKMAAQYDNMCSIVKKYYV